MVQGKKLPAEETKEIRHFKLLISFGLSTAFCIGSRNERSEEDHRGKKNTIIIIIKIDFYITSNSFVTPKA